MDWAVVRGIIVGRAEQTLQRIVLTWHQRKTGVRAYKNQSAIKVWQLSARHSRLEMRSAGGPKDTTPTTSDRHIFASRRCRNSRDVLSPHPHYGKICKLPVKNLVPL